MKSVLLCRVSSKEQEETGYSLPAQEKLLTAYAQRCEYEVAKAFYISESAGGKKQRELFDEMMSFTKKNDIKIIVIEKADRFTRNFKDSVMMYEWLEADEQRQLHSVKDSLILHKNSRSQEKLNWDIRVVFAKNYIDNLSEEVKKGQEEKLAQGWLPTKPPIGYKTVGEKGHKIHVIDETRMPFVKKMFELYSTSNYSLKKLAETMYNEGLRNNKLNKIDKSRIHEHLTDPFYIGMNRWNDKLSVGKQDTFISKELFDKVHNLLRSKTTPKYSKHNYLFKGLANCKECTGQITWEIQKGIIYGHCNHYRNCSQKTWSKEFEVEEQLLDVLESFQMKSPKIADWIRKALKESHQDEITYRSSAVDELNRKQEQLRQRLDKIYEDKLDNTITQEFYANKAKIYQAELDKVSEAIKKHDNANLKYYELGVNIYDLSQRAKMIYLKAKQKMMLNEQRELIRLMFSKLTLNEGKLAYEYTPAFKLLHKAVQATNSSKLTNLNKNGSGIFELSKESENTTQPDAYYSKLNTQLLE